MTSKLDQAKDTIFNALDGIGHITAYISLRHIMRGFSVLAFLAVATILWLYMNADDTQSSRSIFLTVTEVPIDRGFDYALDSENTPNLTPVQTIDVIDEGKPDEPQSGTQQTDTTPQNAVTQKSGAKKEAITLAKAPAPGLLVETDFGFMPVRSDTGMTSYQAYKRPLTKQQIASTKPKVAVMLYDIGKQQNLTRQATDVLPGEISFAFSPYATNIQDQINYVRNNGHEVFLHMPFHPENYPAFDSGPMTLLRHIKMEQNIERMSQILSAATGYVGVIVTPNNVFDKQNAGIRPILNQIYDRGLMYLEYHNPENKDISTAYSVALGQKAPYSSIDYWIDEELNKLTLQKQLKKLEALAKKRRYAIGMITPTPLSLRMIADWTGTLEQNGLTLVPVSALKLQ